MTTALVLCQNTASATGMFSGTVPAAFTGQTGGLLKVVNAVVNAWVDIQNARPGWRWMETEFTAPTIADTARYSATSWSLTRWAEWVRDSPRRRPFSLYLTATGASDEGTLTEIDWDSYVERYVRGTQTSSRPSVYAISPAGEFCLGPRPDAVYTVRGSYRKGPQILAAGSEEPEMPSRFHRLIELKAAIDLHQQEEGYSQAQTAKIDYSRMMRDLERDQLPRIGTWSAIA